MERKILILEDEENIRGFVVINLKRSGFKVVEAETGEEAVELFEKNNDISIAILDVMLPGIDGYEVCRRLRGLGFLGGIIMLTARVQEDDKVTGLTNGADDYVTKPFSVAELSARIEALYRRISGKPFAGGSITSGVFKLDLRSRELKKNGAKIDLTQVEYTIIRLFMENAHKALEREEILNLVWGKDYSGELKIVDVNIRRLRIKIEEDPANPTHIATVRGFGYMWEG